MKFSLANLTSTGVALLLSASTFAAEPAVESAAKTKNNQNMAEVVVTARKLSPGQASPNVDSQIKADVQEQVLKELTVRLASVEVSSATPEADI